jgi:hypothetical protein
MRTSERRPRSKLVRLSAGTLLNAQALTTEKLQDAIAQGSGEAIAELGRRKRSEDVRKAAVLAALLLLSKRMSDRARDAIVDGRQHARREGARRLLAELTAVGVVLGATAIGSQSARHEILNGAQRRHEEDDAHAMVAADALAGAWRSAAFHAVTKAVRTGESIAETLAGMDGRMKPRIVRTATTETSQAYSAERRAALSDAIEHDKEFAASVRGDRLMREWVAMLDACEHCWPHDGERVDVGDSFGGGDEPGEMHPHCHCFDVLVTDAGEAAA